VLAADRLADRPVGLAVAEISRFAVVVPHSATPSRSLLDLALPNDKIYGARMGLVDDLDEPIYIHSGSI
jgi:hypothetical protein